MRSWGKTPHFFVALNCVCFSAVYAEDVAPTAEPSAVSQEAAPVVEDAAATTSAETQTPANNSAETTARDALKQKSTDASSEKDLEKVFQSVEKNYSLSKKGQYSMNYDFGYSFYRDKQIDIALDPNGSSVQRLRITDDAQHSFTNTFDISYGLRDNLTFNVSLPLLYKIDSVGGKEAVGLGDMALGLRWQPIPLKRGLPTTTFYSSLSLATGDSPYEINSTKDLATGKGYYSLSAGVSMSKVTDPIVLFGSAGLTIGNGTGGLNQAQSGRTLQSFSPGQTLSTSFGFAYSLNYDVSMSASYQQSISTNARYGFLQRDENNNPAYISFDAPTQLSSLLNYTLSLRTSPKRIVNLSVGFGLSEDTPDVNLGLSMPLEFLGLAQE
ncbi:MAG: hypothetical protein KDI39_19075 [Pseudomonadales bacterium]|nr:hypothetical protein [Pseudomonadales bacterium]